VKEAANEAANEGVREPDASGRGAGGKRQVAEGGTEGNQGPENVWLAGSRGLRVEGRTPGRNTPERDYRSVTRGSGCRGRPWEGREAPDVSPARDSPRPGVSSEPFRAM
jgi:hypothetical protein